MKDSWKSVTWGGALIVLLTIMVYLPAMPGGFVFDDGSYITDNPLVKARDGLYRIWFTTEPIDYYPLTSSLWWLEWQWWGNDPRWYHVVNVIQHAINSVLVWMVLRGLGVRGAWWAGLVFAVHPVNTTTVAWISEQKNTLSMFFCAMTVLLYLKFEEATRWRWYVLSLVAFLLALLSKAAVVMLPFVLLGCVWWRHGRVSRKDLCRSGPFFALSLVLGLVTIWFQHNRALGGQAVRMEGFFLRLVGAGWVPWFYLFKAIVPVNLSLIYPNWNISHFGIVSYLPGASLAGCLILFWWRRESWGRSLLFGVGSFVVMLFPVLGFIDQGFYRYSLVADHWQYYSIVGIIALAVAAGRAMFEQAGFRRPYMSAAAGAGVLALLGTLTWNRATVFSDAEMLWRDTLTKNPRAWVAHYNLGVVLEDQGKMAEAVTEYRATLQFKPDHAKAHYNLGNALANQGRLAEAIIEYRATLEIMPNHVKAHNNLGGALAFLGKLDEAAAEYQMALRLQPDLWETRCNLARVRTVQGRLVEAEAEYRAALGLNPDLAEARYNLGSVLSGQGKTQEAVAQYRELLGRSPGWAPALGRLAWVLATEADGTVRNGVEAVSLAEQLCEVTGHEQAEALDVLGVAYAEAGRFAEAVQAAQKAVGLARAGGQRELAGRIEGRLKLYQAGRPYHE